MGEQAAVALSRPDLGLIPAGVPVLFQAALSPVPTGLSLDRIARSHGWTGLAPFGYQTRSGRLHRILTIDDEPVPVWVEPDWTLCSGVALSPAAGHRAVADMRWVLGLDDDVSGAPAAVASTRLLRSPTGWEDLVKTLFTTNCSWAATTGMVNRLVDVFGTAGAFPAPAVVVEAGADALRADLRVGYRAGALLELAARVADGRLEPERWRDPGVSDEDMTADVLALKGFGPYAAEGMLGLMGRPRGLAVDSWIRARLGGLTAQEIRRRYEPHGRWAGAMLWSDVTADWFTGAKDAASPGAVQHATAPTTR